MTLWMAVTNDEYELPIAVADTCKELATMIGVDAYSIRKHRWWCKTNGVKCQYHKIEVDDDDDDWDVED